jgi:Lar family restriction alleviation protein
MKDNISIKTKTLGSHVFLECPFCGAVENVGYIAQQSGWFRVACDKCGIYGKFRNTAEEAIKAWNTRGGKEYDKENQG